MRHVAVGRKNWLHCGSEKGAERLADIYAVLVTAKLQKADLARSDRRDRLTGPSPARDFPRAPRGPRARTRTGVPEEKSTSGRITAKGKFRRWFRGTGEAARMAGWEVHTVTWYESAASANAVSDAAGLQECYCTGSGGPRRGCQSA